MNKFKSKNIKYIYKKYFLLITFLSLIFTSIFSTYNFYKKDKTQVIEFKLTNKNSKDIYLLTNLETDLDILNMIIGTEDNPFITFDKSKKVVFEEEGYTFILDNFKKNIKQSGLKIYKENKTRTFTSFIVGSNVRDNEFKNKLNKSFDKTYYEFKQFIIKKTENYRDFYLDHIVKIIEEVSVNGSSNTKILNHAKTLKKISNVKIDRIKGYLKANNLNTFIEITDSQENVLNNFDLIKINTDNKNIYLFSIIIFLMFKIFFIFIIVVFKNR